VGVNNKIQPCVPDGLQHVTEFSLKLLGEI
jgi:hypothetical protein